ncbi:primosomal replication protein N [Castellaniella sp.]|uniref:primosomal replication protein N n=1 Tax=Castellaniella sp. TaxID=1955812 RepID=UPI00356B4956
MSLRSVNQLELVAQASQVEPLRHTPAGTPIAHLRLEHQGEASEAGLSRQVGFGIRAVAVGPLAQQLAAIEPGTLLQVCGFLAPQRQGSDQLVLHVQQFKTL